MISVFGQIAAWMPETASSVYKHVDSSLHKNYNASSTVCLNYRSSCEDTLQLPQKLFFVPYVCVKCGLDQSWSQETAMNKKARNSHVVSGTQSV